MSGKTMHLALFLPSLRGGGAERVMLILAEAFAERGHRVDLVLAKAEGPYLDDVSGKVRVVDLRASRVIRSLPALVRYLRSERPEAMFSAMGHANVVAIMARSISRASTQVVVGEHSMLSLSVKNTLLRRARLMPRLMRYCYPRADGVIAVSNGVADDLAEAIGLPRIRITPIYNPVVTVDVLTRSHEPTNHPWFRPGEPPVVLSVGRLTQAKDFSTLIRAFELVRKVRPVRLLILGEGEERDQLEQFAMRAGIASDLSMPGFVQNPFAFMRAAALFVLSSRWEGLPSVLIEAMACGCPVVSTDCLSGPDEILEHGKYGTLVDVGSAVRLSEAMLAALDDPNPPDVVRRAQDFGVERAVVEYLEMLSVEDRPAGEGAE